MTALVLGLAVGVCVGVCAALAWEMRQGAAAVDAWADAWRSECAAHDATRAELQQREAMASAVCAVQGAEAWGAAAGYAPVALGADVRERFCWN